MVKEFNGMQYLAIDIANQYGLDKLLFEERINWVKENQHSLEELADKAETKPLYIKAVQAFRKAQQGIPTGHLVGLDGVCSGVQIMSVLTNCMSGAEATGLINPNKRADAYTAITDAMNTILAKDENIASEELVEVSRSDAKQATMTAFYGSKATPKAIFGEDTPEYNAFIKAMEVVAPGAYALLQSLLKSWNPQALVHEWKLPDGFDARVKVMTKVKASIEVQELGGSTFNYEYYENLPQEYGLSNAANVVHSVDAYVLRCMHRRCNYDSEVILRAKALLEEELQNPLRIAVEPSNEDSKVAYYVRQYLRCNLADIVILPYLNQEEMYLLPDTLITGLLGIINQMLKHKSFELVTIHDEFKCHANNANFMRMHYRNILADIAESNLLQDLLSQLFHTPMAIDKPEYEDNFADLVRNSNYGLC
ncbi:DNA-dependent RNA polymerase [Oligella urethralis]|uniref:DNA-directed RNA polymerase n=1 Tax=Oligella urethralis TaxID=90245 RepID=UPI000DFCBCBD|nr:DNA-directed RNA polymerase [Oligella urethralis]SUA63376.1 DNA-dependent RNA polymerase [Oligella urethralis]